MNSEGSSNTNSSIVLSTDEMSPIFSSAVTFLQTKLTKFTTSQKENTEGEKQKQPIGRLCADVSKDQDVAQVMTRSLQWSGLDTWSETDVSFK